MNLYCVMLRVTGKYDNAKAPDLGEFNASMTSNTLLPSSPSSPQSLQRDSAGIREKLPSAGAGGQLVGDLGIFLNRSRDSSKVGTEAAPYCFGTGL